ncbi:MAG: hypothetical protein ACHREM_28860, partial [Polyangiales bacterium]
MPLLLGLGALVLVLSLHGSSAHASSWGPQHVPMAADVDPGMAQDAPALLAVVQTAIRRETNPANLRGFAAALRPFYP